MVAATAPPKRNRVLELMAKFEAEEEASEASTEVGTDPSLPSRISGSLSKHSKDRVPAPSPLARAPPSPVTLGPGGQGAAAAARQAIETDTVPLPTRGGYGRVKPPDAQGDAPERPRPTKKAWPGRAKDMTVEDFSSMPRWHGSEPAMMTDQLVRRNADPDFVEVNLHFKFLSEIQRTPSMGKSLRILDVSSNNIREIKNLQGLDNLCELRLDCCMIAEIPPLCLPGLTVLNLEDNRIAEIKGLEKCQKLETLNVSTNEIVSLAGCVRFKNLKHLYAARNHIAQVEMGRGVLAEMGGLVTLDLSENGFTKLPHGCLPANLEDLLLEGNELASGEFLFASRAKRARADRTEVLSGVTGLQSLLLRGNRFTDVASFPPLTSLVDLDLRDNRVESLADLPGRAPNLEVLDVSGNYVATLQQVSKLDAMVSLCDIWIERNPVARDHPEDDVLKALALLPTLDHVNGKPFVLDAVQRLGLTMDAGQGAQLRDELGATGRPGTSSGRPGTSSGRTGGDLGATGRPGTPGALSLSGTATLSLSRPGSSAGRPASSAGRTPMERPVGEMGEQTEGVRKSASHLEQRGVRDPLMFARSEKSGKHCWTKEQVDECSAVLAREFSEGQKRMDRDYRVADHAITGMRTFLTDAEKTLKREAQLQLQHDQKFPSAPDAPAEWGLDALSKVHGEPPPVQPQVTVTKPKAPTPERNRRLSLSTVIEVEESFVTEVDVAGREMLRASMGSEHLSKQEGDLGAFLPDPMELVGHPLLELDAVSPRGKLAALSPRANERLAELDAEIDAEREAELTRGPVDLGLANTDSDFSDLSDGPSRSTTAGTRSAEPAVEPPAPKRSPDQKAGARLRDARAFADKANIQAPRGRGKSPRKAPAGRSM